MSVVFSQAQALPDLFAAVLGFSLSGGLLILVLLGCGRLLKGRLGWRWLYYLWLTAVFRLLIPFSLELPLLPSGALPEQVRESEDYLSHSAETVIPKGFPLETFLYQTEAAPSMIPPSIIPPLWAVWLTGVGLTLGKRVRDYRGFLRLLQKDLQPVTDPRLLEHFQRLKIRGGIQGKAGLYFHPALSTPIVVGWIRPCIIITDPSLPEKELDFILLHELSHCRRRDGVYKRLVQLCVCLHWFNPLVYRMEQELNRLCELACDESVLKNLSLQERAAYGDMLVHSLSYAGEIAAPRFSPALKRETNLWLLKERLGEMMKPQRKSKTVLILSALISCAVVTAASVTMVQAVETPTDALNDTSAGSELLADPEKSVTALTVPASSPLVQPEYVWPVGGDGGSVSAKFDPVRRHDGMDIAAEKGTPICVVRSGTVLKAETDIRRGKYIVVLHSDGNESWYCHCSELLVKEGQEVAQGEQIGKVGQTGMATGPHLHIEIQKDGKPQAPENYLGRSQ